MLPEEKRNVLIIKLGVRDSIGIRLNQDFILIDKKKTTHTEPHTAIFLR